MYQYVSFSVTVFSSHTHLKYSSSLHSTTLASFFPTWSSEKCPWLCFSSHNYFLKIWIYVLDCHNKNTLYLSHGFEYSNQHSSFHLHAFLFPLPMYIRWLWSLLPPNCLFHLFFCKKLLLNCSNVKSTSPWIIFKVLTKFSYKGCSPFNVISTMYLLYFFSQWLSIDL